MRHLLWNFILFYGISITFSTDVTKHPSWSLLEHRKCGISNSDRIIGGKNASLGAYPWIARIGYGNPGDPDLSYRCGGTLINKLYVLTAAHCVMHLPENLKVGGVRLGEHNTLTDIDCEREFCAEPVQDFSPKLIITHKNYNKPVFKNDIALIRLDHPAVYNEFVMPICMLYGELLVKNFAGETAEVAGWGIYDINDPQSSTILQTLKVPVVEMNKCLQSVLGNFAEMSEQNQMCVGGIIGEDSCGGDSGGPLMKVLSLGHNGPRYYLIGIVSFGAKACGASRTPAIYSKVAAYTTWILNHIQP